MRISTVRLLGASLVALSLSGVAMAEEDHSRCSNATVVGSWGFTTSGTVVLPSGPAPAVVVGRFNLDKAGNLEGTQTRSLNPVAPDRETITGTILVNSELNVVLLAAPSVSAQVQRGCSPPARGCYLDDFQPCAVLSVCGVCAADACVWVCSGFQEVTEGRCCICT